MGGAGPADQARLLHALEQRREGARVEVEALAQGLHCQAVVLPEQQQDQILRIGEPQLGEQRLIGLRDGPGRGVERKADLILEPEGLVGHDQVMIAPN